MNKNNKSNNYNNKIYITIIIIKLIIIKFIRIQLINLYSSLSVTKMHSEQIIKLITCIIKELKQYV